MPGTLEAIMSGARTWMRDYPRFFSAAVSRQSLTQTLKLPHGNVLPFELSVTATNDTDTAVGSLHAPGFIASASTFSYLLDEREGLLRIQTDRVGGMVGWNVSIEGYYYEWVSDFDLRFHANNIVAEHAYNRDFSFDYITDAEEDAMALGAAVSALTAILAEMARDVDYTTPEAVSLPLSQRFRQMTQLLYGPGGLKEKYHEKAAMLGVGMDKVEVGTLRRVSRTTGRLVPEYEALEYDDARHPIRVFPRRSIQGPHYPPSDFVAATNVTYDMNGNVVAVEN